MKPEEKLKRATLEQESPDDNVHRLVPRARPANGKTTGARHGQARPHDDDDDGPGPTAA